ncbi:MAG: type II toxin-antitoxin system prevent-host-death family antitoxin [Marinobacter sp.]|nr:type II toxin-antitoxin system prevent-host-death family antitoxin [Marinobacter sp.]
MTNRPLTLTDLKNDPADILKKNEDKPRLIFDNNKPWAYLVPVEIFKRMREEIDDYQLLQQAQGRLGDESVSSTLEELRTRVRDRGWIQRK